MDGDDSGERMGVVETSAEDEGEHSVGALGVSSNGSRWESFGPSSWILSEGWILEGRPVAAALRRPIELSDDVLR